MITEQFQPDLRSGLVVLIFIGFDILFGLLQALNNRVFESKIMRQGLFHKLGEILSFIFGAVCNVALPEVGVVLPFSLSAAISVYIVIMEIGSILENLSKLSPEMSKYLGVIFEKIKTPVDVPEEEQNEPEER